MKPRNVNEPKTENEQIKIWGVSVPVPPWAVNILVPMVLLAVAVSFGIHLIKE